MLRVEMKFRNLVYITFISLLLSSCGLPDKAENQLNANNQYSCVIDPAMVHSWQVYGELNEPEFPFQQIYQGCGKTLIYIAARHGNDPEGETFKLIEKSFQTNAIDFAIVEGFGSDMGVSPKDMIEYADRMKGTPGDAEPYLTIRLAKDADAKFQGGEPSDKQIINEVSEESISPTDLLGYYIVRQIPQLIRREQIHGPSDPRLNDVIFNMVGSFAEQTGISIDSLNAIDGITNFSKWYQATNGVSFQKGYREEDSWPSVTDPDFLRTTNQIANTVGNARDHHIVGIIDDTLRKYDTVLIVYGGSHHTIQEPALKAAFKD